MGQGVVLRLNASPCQCRSGFAYPSFCRRGTRSNPGTSSSPFCVVAAQPENAEESSGNVPLPEQLPADTSSLVPTTFPTPLPEAQYEELAEDNATRHDWIAKGGKQEREVRGTYQRTADLRISTTDPDATPMRLKGGGIHLGYHTHYVVDGGKRRIILAVLVVPGEVMDNQPMRDLLWYVYFRWRVRPRHVDFRYQIWNV